MIDSLIDCRRMKIIADQEEKKTTISKEAKNWEKEEQKEGKQQQYTPRYGFIHTRYGTIHATVTRPSYIDCM